MMCNKYRGYPKTLFNFMKAYEDENNINSSLKYIYTYVFFFFFLTMIWNPEIRIIFKTLINDDYKVTLR